MLGGDGEQADTPVSLWLRDVGMADLVGTFRAAKYDDLGVVKELTKEDLLELGISEPGRRKKLLVHASRLPGGEEAGQTTRRCPSFDLSQPWHKEVKIMNDGLHGHMHMPTYCVQFIDTPQFQRLRDLKQLGTSYYGTSPPTWVNPDC